MLPSSFVQCLSVQSPATSSDNYGSAHEGSSDTARYFVHLTEEGLIFQVTRVLLE